MKTKINNTIGLAPTERSSRLRAVCYYRVSTEEQAKHGFSLDHQHKMLVNYCALKGIDLVMHFREDGASGKDFDRPEFKRLAEFVKKGSNNISLLLVLKWDRFGRNVEQALTWIKRFNRMGIQVDAAEQPLDLSNPDNKMMLAFYLTASEIENDKISKRTCDGMREALEQGRYVYRAPFGYTFKDDEFKKKVLTPMDGEGLIRVKFVQDAFEEFAKGIYNMEELRKKLVKKHGVKCCKQNFYNILRNKIYAGICYGRRTVKEEEFEIKGIHEPLVSEELFFKVEGILTGKRRVVKKAGSVKDAFVLRGFIICPKCGKRRLTGSNSKGNGGLYAYLHCQKGCDMRIASSIANQKFVALLEGITFKEPITRFYTKVLEDTFKTSHADKAQEISKYDKLIAERKAMIVNIGYSLGRNEITSAEYRKFERRYNDDIAEFVDKISQLNVAQKDFMRYQRANLLLLQDLKNQYLKADNPIKQKIVGSIFPRKIEISENEYRTENINSMIAALTSIDAGLGGKKMRQPRKVASKPTLAPEDRFFSKSVQDGLSRILMLYPLLIKYDILPKKRIPKSRV